MLKNQYNEQVSILEKGTEIIHVGKEIKAETENGKIAKTFIDKGLLVPVELVGAVIKNRLSQPDCVNGFILDGFPRSLEQAKVLDVIQAELDADKEVDFLFRLANTLF